MMNEAAYAEANHTYWTHRAPSYGDVNRKELATAQRRIWTQTLDVRIQARFPDRARSSIRVLDVGTGPGFFAVILNALGYAVTAVDYTNAMLNEARLNAGEAAEHIHFHCMDAEKLGFADASFDVVVSRNLTWNLPHPERAYAEWARVLKPNGLLLNYDANWYRSVLSRRMRPAWDHALLRALSMCVTSNEDIWKEVWTEDERINNASTPMFLVQAVKTAAAEEGSR